VCFIIGDGALPIETVFDTPHLQTRVVEIDAVAA
jgi:hypothetical protein